MSQPALDVVGLRRDFHRYPEVGFCEFRTASRAAGILADLGWQVRTGPDVLDSNARLGIPELGELATAYELAVANGADQRFLPAMRGGLTGVVASLRGNRPGPRVGLRADLDALPLTESGDAAHRPNIEGFGSRWDGAMHACGHDGHVAVALTVAARLTDRDFPGTVALILQPAEEGGRGAAAMVAAGVADELDVFLAAHLGLGLPTGSVCARIAGLLANAKLRAQFSGVAAHAAMAPEHGRHALLAAAAATLAVHTLPPFSGHQTRVNVGMLRSGTASNIIPADAVLLMETRADDAEVCDLLEQRARAMICGAAASYGVDVHIDLVGAAPTASNDPRIENAVAESATALGLSLTQPGSGIASDDAMALLRRVQQRGGVGGYFGIGANSPAPHHAQRFDLDEAALPIAVDLLEKLLRSPLSA